MKKNKGSNLVEYIIPTALIGTIVGISLYNIFTNNSLLDYIMASCNMELKGNTLISKNSSASASTGSTTSNSSTKTTIGNATTECKDNSCSIDFGTLKLSGVPKDLNSLIETAGTAGATDSILALLQQVAEQQKQTDPAEAQKLEALIASGKEIMQLEQIFDDWYTKNEGAMQQYYNSKIEFAEVTKQLQSKYNATCVNNNCTFNSKTDKQAYYNELYAKEDSIVKIPNKDYIATYNKIDTFSINGLTTTRRGAFQEMDFLLNPTAVYHLDTNNNITAGSVLKFDTTKTSMLNDMLTGVMDPEAYKDPNYGLSHSAYPTGSFVTSPVAYYITELKNVLQNSKSPEVKNITTQLSQEIFDITARVAEKSDKIHQYTVDLKEVNLEIPTNDAVITTNLDLSIICASHGGKYDNKNKECK